MTLIVIQFLILMAELDPFHLVQLLLFLRELFHPQLGDLVVPFFKDLSVVSLESLILDLPVDLLEELLLDSFGSFFMLGHLFFLPFLKGDFL